MNFEFATATWIAFGRGKIAEAGKLAAQFGSRAFVVTGHDATRAECLLGQLSKKGIQFTTFSVAREPTIELVEKGIAAAKADRSEVVIAIGGGSVLDTGKAVAAMLTNAGELLDYLEVIGNGRALEKASAPFIAIPTTAGTGAEVTRNAVLAAPEHHVKVSLRSPLMLPSVALVDPELALGLPPQITASTGLDALTQLIEPFTCNRANPMTDALCLEGMKRAARSLRVAFCFGDNIAAREDMALASLFSGIALANAGLGAVHGFAAPIGGMFAAPHGAVCAALLPHVMRANIEALSASPDGEPYLSRYDEAARCLTGRESAKADDGAAWAGELVRELNVPPLGAYGISATDVTVLIEKAANASSMKANPVNLSSEQLGAILEAAL